MQNIQIEETVISFARKIKILLLDVDGVLTDGRIIYNSRGEDSKFFDVHDGLGVYMLKKSGIPTILVTAKGSAAIKPRARDMQVAEVYADICPKTLVLDKVLKKYKLQPSEVCFVGDDLVDLCVMKRVGFPIAVFNAASEVKQKASYITLRHGGRGAVREVAELILKAKGLWPGALADYDI